MEESLLIEIFHFYPEAGIEPDLSRDFSRNLKAGVLFRSWSNLFRISPGMNMFYQIGACWAIWIGKLRDRWSTMMTKNKKSSGDVQSDPPLTLDLLYLTLHEHTTTHRENHRFTRSFRELENNSKVMEPRIEASIEATIEACYEMCERLEKKLSKSIKVREEWSNVSCAGCDLM